VSTVVVRTVVVKFGGTSLRTPSRIQRAAKRVKAFRERGHDVVVVVSARGDSTDRILDDLAKLGSPAQGRELDRALTTGEDLSAALLATALATSGLAARSLRGGEAGVEARGDFGSGTISRVDPEPLRLLLRDGVVPVVSGFQGRRGDAETLTLGRGGSDTSAVAIAAALGPAPCDIVTDVDAVYDRDPRTGSAARRLPSLTHRALLDLAAGGAQVVHREAAWLALIHRVPLRIYRFDAPLAGPRVFTEVHPERDAPAAPAPVAEEATAS